ncbi:protein tis11 [Anaeramoeba ignava]|uniref:Protein tis11 n=1 Tax=Anaeramoeba ignava TaxID=1746090 RepID=A0A9Q0L7X7_ANAIG|nr:protein tis11 [Anaeramoeba ignava]|eukprot:Anaeramoba_ignava/a482981_91.p1 GENE.a482981_91~~a482981_91.p1  ORF type:complete len:206 (-),score=61.34 a482981_91:46-663(-)
MTQNLQINQTTKFLFGNHYFLKNQKSNQQFKKQEQTIKRKTGIAEALNQIHYNNSTSEVFKMIDNPSIQSKQENHSHDQLKVSNSPSKIHRSKSQKSKKPPKQKSPLYKTELCKSWEENGFCKYGQKCQFAHGYSELRFVPRHPKYKTQICQSFHTNGFCSYGKRCRFLHHRIQANYNSNVFELFNPNAQPKPKQKRLPVFESLC